MSDARGVIEEIRQGNRFMVNPFIRSDGKILASSIETGKIYQLEAGIKKEEEKPIGAMPQSFFAEGSSSTTSRYPTHSCFGSVSRPGV